LILYLIGLGRFFTILSAMDTGSSFEGMGASREAQFAPLTEVAVFTGLAALTVATGSLSLTQLYHRVDLFFWDRQIAAGILILVSFFIVLLAENCRIPVDDPNTHLELTMIHEVMVLDHTGPDLAMIEYGAALKLWAFGSLVVGALAPRTGRWPADFAVGLAGLLAVAVATGIAESVMARLRLTRVPQLLVAASVLAVLALAMGIAGALS